LNAEHDININNAINVDGDGTLKLLYGHDYTVLTPASFSGAVIDPVTGYPVAKVDDREVKTYGSINFNGAGGNLYIGGETDAFKYTLIRDLAGLQAISGVAGNYALAKNIDLSKEKEGAFEASVIASLAADSVFTGLGHVIDNLKIDSETSNTGLFAQTTAGSLIRDIGLTNIDITSTQQYTGALVGTNLADISYVYATGTISGTARVGGLVGLSGFSAAMSAAPPHTISNSFTDVSIIGSGTGQAGGLVGRANGLTIQNSHSFGDVSGSTNIGGLVGATIRPINIYNSYTSGDITGGSNLGGLVGSIASLMVGDTANIEKSFATGNIYGNGGGLIGTITTISDTLNINNVYATGNVASGGGLIGSSTIAQGGVIYLSNAFATGDVGTIDNPANGNSGGLIGYIYGNFIIDSVYATGNVISNGDSIGGLIGRNQGGTVTNAHATGNVKGNDYVGGLVGYNIDGEVSDVWASGDVEGREKVGGLMGIFYNNRGSLTNAYAIGKVTGIADVGGLVGHSIGGGVIINSYYSGDAEQAVGRVENPDGMDVQKVTDEEFAYIDELISGSKDLDEVKTEIAYNKEQARIAEEERIKAEEEARIKAEEQARAEAEAKAKAEAEARAQAEADAKAKAEAQARFVDEAKNSAEALSASADKEQQNKQNVFAGLLNGSFNANSTSIISSNVAIGSYSADVQTINVDGVTYKVEEKE
jgi:hypothetical protein